MNQVISGQISMQDLLAATCALAMLARLAIERLGLHQQDNGSIKRSLLNQRVARGARRSY